MPVILTILHCKIIYQVASGLITTFNTMPSNTFLFTLAILIFTITTFSLAYHHLPAQPVYSGLQKTEALHRYDVAPSRGYDLGAKTNREVVIFTSDTREPYVPLDPDVPLPFWTLTAL